MKKTVSLLLSAVLFLGLLSPGVRASAAGPFGWNGDSSDFSPWTAESGSELRIDASSGGNRRVWKPLLTDRNDFSVSLTVTIHTGRAYLQLMGQTVELNASGGDGNSLYTNIGRQWFSAQGCETTVSLLRRSGGDIYLTLRGKGSNAPVTETLTPTADSADLTLGTYETDASATFSGIRAFCGTAGLWLPVCGYWDSVNGGIFTDNTTGTHARIYSSTYFSGSFALSFDMDFTGFYQENRICSQRIGLSGNAFDSIPVLYDVMVENNGKTNLSLSWHNGTEWVSAGKIPWDNSDIGKHSNRYTVKITREADTLSFALLHSDDGSAVGGKALTVTDMPKAQLDGLHTVTVEAYNGKVTYSDPCVTFTPEAMPLQAGWNGDGAAFSAQNGSTLLAFGVSGQSAWRSWQLPQTVCYIAGATVPFGMGAETKEFSLTDTEGTPLLTLRIEQNATGEASITAWRGERQIRTVPEVHTLSGCLNSSRNIFFTRMDGKDTLYVSWGGNGFVTEPLDGLDTAGGLCFSATKPTLFAGAYMKSYSYPQTLTDEEADAVRYTGLWNGDALPQDAAKTAYENLMNNFLDTENDRLYPVEGGFRNGTVTNNGTVVRVSKAGELWEACILLCAMDTYAQTLDEDSAAWTEVARRIANTVNFFTGQYTFGELTTPASAPVNHAMDDCSWNIRALILGHRYNQKLGNDAHAQNCLNTAVTLFGNTYDCFYDDRLGGGVWYNTARAEKSLYAAMLALDGWDLYELTGEEALLAKTLDIYNGIENNLRRTDGLYWCSCNFTGAAGIGNPYGIREAGSVSFLGGNMAMAVLNARMGNLGKARQTAAGISLHQTNDLGVYVNDRDAWVNTVFLGLWTRELLNTGILGDEYCKTLRETAYSVLEYATLSDGYYSAAWSGPAEPSSDGYPADYDGERNPWGRGSNGTCTGSVPKQMMTSATTAHIILAAAAIDCPTEPHRTYAADLFGWQSDDGDLSCWTAQTEYDLTGSFAGGTGHRIFKNYIQDPNDLSVSLNITVDENTNAFVQLLGVTLELDGRLGGGQADLILSEKPAERLFGADGCFHIDISRAEGGDLYFTVTGKGNGSVTLTCPAAEESDRLVLGVLAGKASFRRLTVHSGESIHIHLWEDNPQKSIAPTCTQDGLLVKSCISCGEHIAETVSALGHDFADGFCTRCGAEDPNYIPPADPCEGYTDIDRNAWYHPYADFVIKEGLMGSTTSGLTFEPSTACTRGMIVTVLYSLAGKPEVKFEAKFPDVKDKQWYTAPVMWAYQNNVVSGYDTGYFGTNDKVTREQLAVIFKAYAEKIEKRDTTDRADLSGFADSQKATWSKDALAWAVAAGLISGKPGANGTTLLDPQGKASRAEVAVMLMQFLKNNI